MTSWSDRADVEDELLAAHLAGDQEKVRELLAEKHGPEYADEVLAGLCDLVDKCAD